MSVAGGAAPSDSSGGKWDRRDVKQSQLGRWGSPPDGEAPGPAARKSQGTGSRSRPQAQGPGGRVLRVLSITGRRRKTWLPWRGHSRGGRQELTAGQGNGRLDWRSRDRHRRGLEHQCRVVAFNRKRWGPREGC